MENIRGKLVDMEPELFAQAFEAWKQGGGIASMIDPELVPKEGTKMALIDSNSITDCVKAAQTGLDPLLDAQPQYIMSAFGMNETMELWRVYPIGAQVPDSDSFFFEASVDEIQKQQEKQDALIDDLLAERRKKFEADRAKYQQFANEYDSAAILDKDIERTEQMKTNRATVQRILDSMPAFEEDLLKAEQAERPNVRENMYLYARYGSGSDFLTMPTVCALLRLFRTSHEVQLVSFNRYRRAVLRMMDLTSVRAHRQDPEHNKEKFRDIIHSVHARHFGAKVAQTVIEPVYGVPMQLKPNAEEMNENAEELFFMQYSAAIAESEEAARKFRDSVRQTARAIARILRPEEFPEVTPEHEKKDYSSSSHSDDDDDDAPALSSSSSQQKEEQTPTNIAAAASNATALDEEHAEV